MIFTDYLYLPLVLITALVYFVVPLSVRWFILLAASVVFYYSWGIELMPFLLGAVLVAWLAALQIEKIYEKNAEKLKGLSGNNKERAAFQQKVKNKCKAVLWIAVVLIFGTLIFTKTEKFIFNTFNITNISILVPLGISYYSMSLVSYVADVYWKREKAEKNFLKLLLFAMFFPKIVEGPISKHKLIGEQLNRGNEFDYKHFCFGLQLIIWGYFKKLVIADRIDQFVSPVFANYKSYHGSVLLVAAVFSAFDIYCDFSGCIDMALGTAEIFGIKMEDNFKRPFFAKSASEYWKRWHITLGNWTRDYVYMPILISPTLHKVSAKVKKSFGARAGKAVSSLVPLYCVWFLTGLWHGTGIDYVVWGMYWGTIMAISSVFEPEIKKFTTKLGFNTSGKGYQRFMMIRTFFIFVGGRVLTLPGDLHASFGIVKRVLLNFGAWDLVDGTLYTIGMERPDFIFSIIFLLILYYVDRKQEDGVIFRECIAEMPIVRRWAFYLLAVAVVLIFGVYGAGYNAGSFVYMNF